MNNKIAIKVENISKRYRIGLKEEIHDSVVSALASWIKSPINNFKQLQKLSNFKDEDNEDIIWAVKNVSFEVKQGEVLGIIGKNGAGKSTLLKILSRITEPTSGKIEINGRVASLLEVGTGFHGELTGRENVYLNGTILGMTKKEVDKKFEEIVAFSGVEKFIDTPVKRYSSGMMVRLAFAVAAHLDPEILIIDEVLAVGDVEFQRKCLGKMKNIAGLGRTVLFVSHNMEAIKNLCSSTMLLKLGEIDDIGITIELVKKYLDMNFNANVAFVDKKIIDKAMDGVILKSKPTIRVNQISILDNNNNSRNKFSSDEEIIITIKFITFSVITGPAITCFIKDSFNNTLLVSEIIDDIDFITNYYVLNSGYYEAKCIIPPNIFGSNEYYLSFSIVNPKIEHISLEKILSFSVEFKGFNNNYHYTVKDTYFRPQYKWKLNLL